MLKFLTIIKIECKFIFMIQNGMKYAISAHLPFNITGRITKLYFVGFIDNVNICEILSIFEIFFKNLSKFKLFFKNFSIFKLVQFYTTIKLKT